MNAMIPQSPSLKTCPRKDLGIGANNDVISGGAHFLIIQKYAPHNSIS